MKTLVFASATLLMLPGLVGAQNGALLDLVEFRAVPLEHALRALSEQTGLQAAASPKAQAVPISIYLQRVTGEEALRTICTTHGLWMTGEPGAQIARIYTAEEYARDSSSFLQEQTRVFTLRYPNARDMAITIRDLYGDRVQLARRVDDAQESGEFEIDDLGRRLERFDLIDSRSESIGALNSNGGASTRRDGAGSRSGQGSRGTYDLRETAPEQQASGGLSAEEMAKLDSGRASEREAGLEALLRSRADIFVTVIDRLNKVMVRTRDERTMNEIQALVKSLDVPTPMVLLEVQILAVELEKGLETAFNWTFSDPDVSIGVRLAPGGPITNPTLVFSALDDRFNGTMKLLEKKGKVTALGKPILLTANHEVSRIFIGEEVPLNRSFEGGQTVVSDGGDIVGAGSTDIEFRPVGSTLLVTPSINDDRTVMLRVLQEESKIVKQGADVLVPSQDGGFEERSLDTVAAESASGTFAARDGQTIAIGGLIREEIRDERSQIPILGDIPILGIPFRATQTTRIRREVILLMTPHIIAHPTEAQAASKTVIGRSSLHPVAPGGGDGLGLFRHRDVLAPGSDDTDWNDHWVPRLLPAPPPRAPATVPVQPSNPMQPQGQPSRP